MRSNRSRPRGHGRPDGGVMPGSLCSPPDIAGILDLPAGPVAQGLRGVTGIEQEQRWLAERQSCASAGQSSSLAPLAGTWTSSPHGRSHSRSMRRSRQQATTTPRRRLLRPAAAAWHARTTGDRARQHLVGRPRGAAWQQARQAPPCPGHPVRSFQRQPENYRRCRPAARSACSRCLKRA